MTAETDKPTETPAEEPTDKASEEPSEASTAAETDPSAGKSAKESADKASEEATETSTAAETDPSAGKPTKESADKASEEATETSDAETEKGPQMHWYVLRVQSNKEDKVLDSLQKRVQAAGLEEKITRIMVPTEKVSEIKAGQKRVSERKIYPGYVMVEMILDDDTWYLIRETPGVGDFLGGAPNTRPMPMLPEEVDKILGQAEKEEAEQPKLKIEFREGEAVKITEGPFENFSGVVEEVLPAKGLVKVVVTIFGRPTPVELEYWQIEAI